MKGDQVELTPRLVVAALLYAAAKTAVLYFAVRAVIENAQEDLPRHASMIHGAVLVLAVVLFIWWVLRPLIVLVRQRRDLG